MELEKLIGAVGLVLVGVIALFAYINYLNSSYNTDLGITFNDTLSSVQNITQSNLIDISSSVGNNTIPESGSGPTTQDQGLIAKSLSTLSKIRNLLGLIPDVMGGAARIMGVPDAYVSVAKWVFISFFALTIAYIFILGVKKLLGL